MIPRQSSEPGAHRKGSRCRIFFGMTGVTAVLLVGILCVPSLIPTTPTTQPRVALSASIPPWNTWTCNPNNPSPTALNIPAQNPKTFRITGATLTVTYEFKVLGYVKTDHGMTVYLPTAKAVLPTVPAGNLSLTLPGKNVTITGSSWTSPALLYGTTKLTSRANFSTASAYLTTSKYAVMANAHSGFLTLEFRWHWGFIPAMGGAAQNGSWSVPSMNATSPYLPSIFYPAPYVGIVSTTASPAVAGTVFNLKLNGTVANTSFRMVLEYPNNGSEIQSIWENSSVNSTLFNVTVPLSYRSGVPLPSGNYMIHVHDVCEAIVQMHSVVVVTDDVVARAGTVRSQMMVRTQ